jgi:tetratricopeptide (TPR) repeat protein
VHAYGVRDVEKLLRLPRATIRSLVQAGFVQPARGPRNAWLFSFQDLIVLRTAQALAATNLPPGRLARSLKALRNRLPASMPLSGLSILAEGGRVVVREGSQRWRADSGQYLLAFEPGPQDGTLSVIDKPTRPRTDWLARAQELEEGDADAAIAAYARALQAEPALLDAHLNRGRLLHDTGRLRQAERAYRDGLKACGDTALLHYNLGVLLEDMDRRREAVLAYEAALRRSPDFADCHYNLALLYQILQRPRDAIRHMAHYRRLSAGKE